MLEGMEAGSEFLEWATAYMSELTSLGGRGGRMADVKMVLCSSEH